MYYRRYSDYAIRILGRVRLTLYYAKQWMFVWLGQRFEGDVEWLKSRLSEPGEVKVDANGTPRFHASTASDLNVLEELVQKLLEEAAAKV